MNPDLAVGMLTGAPVSAKALVPTDTTFMSTLLLLLSALLASAPAQNVTWNRDDTLRIPLNSEATAGGYWGLADRKADHAAVATNSEGDVLVAFHSTRDDFNGNLPTLKQVEIALLTYDDSTQTWTWIQPTIRR